MWVHLPESNFTVILTVNYKQLNNMAEARYGRARLYWNEWCLDRELVDKGVSVSLNCVPAGYLFRFRKLDRHARFQMGRRASIAGHRSSSDCSVN